MKAVVRDSYGLPDVLALREVERPSPGPDDVLVRVHACSVNASDWEFLTGSPAYVRMWGPFKPRVRVLGSDIAGRVEAVGESVTQLRVGDEVFGDVMGRWGGFAEFASVPARMLRIKPASLSFEQAAALPQAALVALQGVQGRAAPGKKVLIKGAGGGSGSFAVQIAKALGAEVTAVDSGLKLALLRSLGADHVVDYTQSDFVRAGERYDLILDLVARRPLLRHRPALTARGSYLLVGGSVPLLLQAATLGPLVSLGAQKLGVLVVEQNQGLEQVVQLIESGRLRPVIERSYPLQQAPAAIAHVGEGRALGKVIVSIPA